MNTRQRGWLGLLAIGAMGALLLSGVVALARAAASTGSAVVVGSKAFSESWILAEIYAQRIEHVTGRAVHRRHALGGTLLAFQGLRGGTIDLYPEYTGTALTAILGRSPMTRAADVLPMLRETFAQQWAMTWLQPQAFDNTYVIAMPRQRAAALGITRISDLAGHPELVAGLATEFVARDDGWPGLAARYGLSPNEVPRAMEAGLMYQAAAAGQVDLISAYATDARLDKFDLIALADDREFFPQYAATPLLGPDVAERHPEIARALAPLAGRLSDAEMRRLNGQVDIEGRDPAQVAAAYLDAIGL